MKCLLDTHFLLWIVLQAPRLDEFTWLERYRPWGVSPVSLLEIQFLAEVGKLEADMPAFTSALLNDRRFLLDEISLLDVVRRALDMTWTRDPFDRLLSAHSAARRVALVTLDRTLRENHRHIPAELR